MFPIFISTIPRGKIGLLYVSILTAVSFWLLFFVVGPNVKTAIGLNPTMTDKLLQSNNSTFVISSFNIIGAILIILGIGILSLEIYYNRQEIKKYIKTIFNNIGVE